MIYQKGSNLFNAVSYTHLDVYKRQALDSVDELETDLDQTKESMYKLSYVIQMCIRDRFYQSRISNIHSHH